MERESKIPRIINTLAVIIAVGIVGKLGFDILASKQAPNLSAYMTWVLYTGICIYINGIAVRMIHMSRLKIECLSYEEHYEPKQWFHADLGIANTFPVIMEYQYQKNLTPFVSSTIEEYEDEDIKVPLSLRVTKFMLSARLLQIVGLTLMFLILVLPKITNDYTLYMGLTQETMQMSALGIISVLLTAILTFYNYCMYTIIEQSMDGGVNKGKKGFMLVTIIFTVYVLIMLIFTLILGITGIQLPILGTIINTNIVNLFIIITPSLSLIQAFILKGTVTMYQYVLNEELS